MQELVDKILKLFRMDVTSEGESNKLVRVLRVLESVLFAYGLVDGIFSLLIGEYIAAISFCAVMVICFFLIHSSYHFKVLTQIIAVNIFTLSGVGYGFYMLGGKTRVHCFLFVLVVLTYFSQYGYYGLKSLYTVVIALLFGILESLGGSMIPVINVDGFALMFYEVVDVVVIFVCISMVCYIYSKESQHLEGKLLEYNTLLKKQASTDALTGLCNRRSAMEFIENLINDSRSPAFCVCMCDIDYFKKVNDSYGHDIGDEVLKGIASAMTTGFPAKTLISRWGGEEFLVIFPDMNGDDAKMVLDIMRSRLKKIEYRAGDKKFGVTVTFGLAEYGYDGNADALIKEADDKLYYGKEHGRDQVVF